MKKILLYYYLEVRHIIFHKQSSSSQDFEGSKNEAEAQDTGKTQPKWTCDGCKSRRRYHQLPQQEIEREVVTKTSI